MLQNYYFEQTALVETFWWMHLNIFREEQIWSLTVTVQWSPPMRRRKAGGAFSREMRRCEVIHITVLLHILLNTSWAWLKQISVPLCMLQDVMKVSGPSYSYHPGTTLLCYADTLSGPPHHQPSSLQGLFGSSEGTSEGSHSSETGDSGRYSHDDTEGSSSRPASLQDEESGESERYEIEKDDHPCVENAEETQSQPVRHKPRAL